MLLIFTFPQKLQLLTVNSTGKFMYWGMAHDSVHHPATQYRLPILLLPQYINDLECCSPVFQKNVYSKVWMR